jgi:hypothetical protein
MSSIGSLLQSISANDKQFSETIKTAAIIEQTILINFVVFIGEMHL